MHTRTRNSIIRIIIMTISYESGVSGDIALRTCIKRLPPYVRGVDSRNAAREAERPRGLPWGIQSESPGPGTGVQTTSAMVWARRLGTGGADVWGWRRWTSQPKWRARPPPPSLLCLFLVLGLRGRGHALGRRLLLAQLTASDASFFQRDPRGHTQRQRSASSWASRSPAHGRGEVTPTLPSTSRC